MNAPVERCELSSGFTISRILTGLWQIADMERDGKTLDHAAAAAAMIPYVDAGFTTFDMADHYGSAEEIVGVYRQQHDPSSVQLFTKWVPKPGPMTRDDVRRAVQRSLDRMRSDCIDLMQYHAWVYADPVWLDGLFWLQELKDEGLIRHLGLTNVDTAHLRVIVHSGIDVVSNQVCFSLLDQRAAPPHGMTEFCVEPGVKLLAFVAQKHEVSMANVACRHVLEEPAVAGIIVGARLGERQHIEDNLRLSQFALDATSRAEIAEALSRLQPIPGDCGDEYRRPPFLTASGDLSHHVDSFPPPYEVKQGDDGRSRVLSGTRWEDMAGFSRAVRHGDRILVSGTTATHRDRAIGGSDVAAQTHFIIDKIEGALISLGGRLQDVVSTRVYVQNEQDWEPVARVHGERFRDILPANTLVQATVIGDENLVEIEAEAVVQGS